MRNEEEVSGVPAARYEMIYKVAGTPALMRRPLRGGLDGAKRLAQHLIAWNRRVEWVEIRASGETVYRTTCAEWK